MPRRRRLRALLLRASLLAVLPAAIGAQATSQGAAVPDSTATHTVKRGDTLWDLAARYLGNPYRWPQLYRLNQPRIQDPDVIEPGWVLVISGTGAVAGRDSVATSEGKTGGDSVAPPPSRPASGGSGARPTSTPSANTIALSALWATRRREAQRVPYLDELRGGPSTARITLPPPRIATAGVRAVQLYDEVRLVMPAGSSAPVGTQLLAVRHAETLKGIGRVAIPTGVLRVLTTGAETTAQLVTQYDQVTEGQMVVPTWAPEAVTDSVPVTVATGPTTAVLWIAGAALLPAPGTAILLARGSGDGLRVGDQVTLEKRIPARRRRDPAPAPIDVAVAQVVRVTRAGASAVLLSRVEGGIEVGTTGRVTARLP